jgi:hypothetical protein
VQKKNGGTGSVQKKKLGGGGAVLCKRKMGGGTGKKKNLQHKICFPRFWGGGAGGEAMAPAGPPRSVIVHHNC